MGDTMAAKRKPPISPSVYTKPVVKLLKTGARNAKQKQQANKKYPHVTRKGGAT